MPSRSALLILVLATLLPTSCGGPLLRIELELSSAQPLAGGELLSYRVWLHNDGVTAVDGAWAKIVSPVEGVTIDDRVVVFGPTPAGGNGVDWIRVLRPTGVAFDPAALQWAIVPGVADFDADGLSDGEEADTGTAFDHADSDGDGVGDSAELLYGSDPLSPYERPAGFSPTTFHAISVRAGGEPAIALGDTQYGWPSPLLGLRPFLLGRPGPGVGGLAFDRHGFLYAARGFELLQLDPLSGAVDRTLPLLHATGAPAHVTRIAFDPATGTLYGVANDPETEAATTQLLRIDLASGLVSESGPPLPVAPAQIAFDPYVDSEHGYRTLHLLPEGPAGETTLYGVRFPDGASWSWDHGRGPVTGIAYDADGSLVTTQRVDETNSFVFGGSMSELFDRPLGALAIPPSRPLPAFGEVQFHPESDAQHVAIGDLDGDGDLDAVTAEGFPDAVGVLRNDGTGQLVLESTIPVAEPVYQVVLADFDADGALDAVAAGGYETYLLRGDGNGGLGPAGSISNGSVGPLLAGDVTGDGLTDLVDASEVLASDGAGGLVAQSPWPLGFDYLPAALAHVDDDGLLDLIGTARAMPLAEQAVVAFRNDGAGGFVEVSRQPLGFWPQGVVAADLDGDGRDEILVHGATADGIGFADRPHLWKLHVVAGALTAPEALPVHPTYQILSLAIGDVTDDGVADVVTAADCEPVQVLVGVGGGDFRPALFPNEQNSCGHQVVLGDLDGDGLSDVLTAGSGLALMPNAAVAPGH